MSFSFSFPGILLLYELWTNDGAKTKIAHEFYPKIKINKERTKRGIRQFSKKKKREGLDKE